MNRPTVSQARQWRPEALREVADAWDSAAGYVQSEIPHDDPDWTGSAADSAHDQMTRIARSAVDAARALIAAAVAARAGADRIGAARQAVLDTVAGAAAEGYRVGDDGVVSPTAAAGDALRLLCGDDTAAIRAMTSTRATELTVRVSTALDVLAVADADTAAAIDEAFSFGAPASGATHPAGAARVDADAVSGWPTMGQDRIAEQIAELTPARRAQLITAAPREVGNTDGVPWPMRVAANRLNIADAILAERRTLDIPVDDKIRTVVAQRYGTRLYPVGAERAHDVIASDPDRRAAAIAEHDRNANQHIAFYQSLLTQIPDPTGRTGELVDRQILAFDPARSSLVELTGDLGAAGGVGVLVPGLNTTMLGSAANTDTVRRFVAEGRGDIAMITYLGGPFPTGRWAAGVWQAADPHFALEMAPRLVAFSEDVNRTVDATGRSVAVTYLGHSYGGSILGTAERLGLTADRVVYVEAAGAGVGVYNPADWHNRNPEVARFSMTAPGDPIGLVQGLPLGPHGADPDEIPGVVRLDTGKRLDGTEMGGQSAHSDVLNEPSDAWHELLGVITGRRS